MAKICIHKQTMPHSKRLQVLTFVLGSMLVFFFSVIPASPVHAKAPISGQSTFSSVTGPQIRITPQEQAWLNKKHTVRVRIGNAPPYQIATPELQGISVDYLKLIGQRLGIHFKFISASVGWQQAVEDLAGERVRYDLLPTMKKTPERARLIAFTQDYIYAPWVIITRTNTNFVMRLEDLSDKRIAIEEGYVIKNLITTEYPQIRLVTFDTTLDALHSVADARNDAYIGNLTVASYIIQQNGLNNLKIAAPTPFGNHDQAMGIRNDWPELASLINKTLASISNTEKREIYNHWFNVRYEHGVDIKKVLIWAGCITFVFLLLLAVTLFWNRNLQQEVKRRIKVEEALVESENRFRSVMETIPSIAVQGYLLDGTVMFWNKASERLYGFTTEEALGANLLDLIIPPEMKEGVVAAVRQMAASGEPIPADELLLQRKDGSRVPVFSSHALIAPFRRPPELFCLDIDLTERKRIEENYVNAKTAAEAANRAKSEFLANMSHEIRTPMNGVIGNAQLLRFTDLTDEQGTLLDYIETDAHTLISVINDVLDISKIEAGKLDLDQTPFSLGSCISDLLKPQEARIHAKGLTLQTEIASDIPDALIGDQLRLKQILRNLVGNAIKFTEKGHIQVHVEKIKQSDDETVIRFSVSDTGVGIKPEAVEKIFAPFSQADTSVTRRFGGTGLGLSICSRLVGLMGGTISVESLEGTGSTFHITLPFLVSHQPLPPVTKIQDTNAPPLWEDAPLRVLLVDDSLTNRTMVASLLRRFGHQVTCSGNGADALERWRTNQHDIILMDIQMPVMDGVEATRIIREHEKNSGGHIPIIALTAHALNEQREHLLASGFDGYVPKPVDLNLLNTEMKRLADRRTSEERQ